MINRTHGGATLKVIECINPRLNKYRVRWDYQPYINEDGEEQGITFLETEFKHKPTIDEVKSVILAWENEKIDNQILSGFMWKDMEIWLSTENQFNYKAAYDLAVQTNGTSLPVMFKFGTTQEPKYYTFTEVADLADFYMSAMTYINTKLVEGWAKKDSIDWNEYENLLNQ